MKKAKEIVSLLLVLAMVFSLAACSGKSPSTSAPASPASSPEASASGGQSVIDMVEEGVITSTDYWFRGQIDVVQTEDTGAAKETPEDTFVTFCFPIRGADPVTTTTENPWNYNVYETLIRPDWKTGELVPCLATEWGYDEEGNFHITLRDDVIFHDGTKLDSDDVMFTLERCATNPASRVASAMKKIDFEKSYVIDDTHLVIVFSEPSGAFVNYLSSGYCGIMSKEFCEKNGEDYDFLSDDAGSGAYRLVETVTGSSQTFERFDQWWGGTPEIKTVVAKSIMDKNAMFIDYENGDLDLAMQNTFDSISRVMRGEVTDSVLNNLLLNRGMYLALASCGDGPLSDIRIRQALAACIDYDELILGVFQDPIMAEVANSYLIPGTKYRKDVGRYEYDPDKAIALLAECGYSVDNPLTLTLGTSDNTVTSAASELVQFYASQVGINIELYVEKSTAVSAALSATDTAKWDIVCINYNFGSGEPDEFFNGCDAYQKEPGQYSCIKGVNDAEASRLMQAGVDAVDDEERAEIYGELQQNFYDNVWNIPLSYENCGAIYRDYLENVNFIGGYNCVWADLTIAE